MIEGTSSINKLALMAREAKQFIRNTPRYDPRDCATLAFLNGVAIGLQKAMYVKYQENQVPEMILTLMLTSLAIYLSFNQARNMRRSILETP